MSGVTKHKKRMLFGDGDTAPCFWCGTPKTFASATVDHIIPRVHGGTCHAANLVIACGPCNSRRGSIPALHFWRFMHGDGGVVPVDIFDRARAVVAAARRPPARRRRDADADRAG